MQGSGGPPPVSERLGIPLLSKVGRCRAPSVSGAVGSPGGQSPARSLAGVAVSGEPQTDPLRESASLVPPNPRVAPVRRQEGSEGPGGVWMEGWAAAPPLLLTEAWEGWPWAGHRALAGRRTGPRLPPPGTWCPRAALGTGTSAPPEGDSPFKQQRPAPSPRFTEGEAEAHRAQVAVAPARAQPGGQPRVLTSGHTHGGVCAFLPRPHELLQAASLCLGFPFCTCLQAEVCEVSWGRSVALVPCVCVGCGA